MQFPQHRPFPNIPGFTVNEQYLLCSTEKLSTHRRGQTVRNTLLSETLWLYKSKNRVSSECAGLLFYARVRLRLIDWVRRMCASPKRNADEAGLLPRASAQAGPFTPNSFSVSCAWQTRIHPWKPSSDATSSSSQGESSSCSSLLPFANCLHLLIKLKVLL